MEKNTVLKKEKVLTFDSLLFIFFVAGSSYLYGKNQVRLLGIAFGYVYFLANVLKLNRILGYIKNMPIEIKLFFLWVIWSVFTGNFIAENHEYFSVTAKRVVQMSLVVLFSYLVIIDRKEPALALWGVLIGAFLQVIWIIVTYRNLYAILSIGERFRAHMLNPNSLGFLMIWATGIVLFITGNRIKSFKFAVLIGSIIGYFILVILATGSRKSFLGIILFLSIWFTWVSSEIFKNSFVRKLTSFVLFSLFIFSFYRSLPFVLERTPVGQRLLILLNQGTESVLHTEHRLDMYIEGIKMFLEHPILGVGLDNFRVHFYAGLYSHSNYIEPLADTGLIGFLLYQSFFFIPLVKLFKILKLIPPKSREKYNVKLLIAIILVILFIGLGSVQYTSIPVFAILTAISVYVKLKKQELLFKNKLQ